MYQPIQFSMWTPTLQCVKLKDQIKTGIEAARLRTMTFIRGLRFCLSCRRFLSASSYAIEKFRERLI